MDAFAARLDPAETARSRRLLDRIAALIAAAGPIAFDRFVEIALYDPSDGYYAQPERTLGRTGDFYTAAHVHPLFGATIAARVAEEYRRQGRPADFVVAEAGAGDGTLAVDLRAAIAAAPELPMLRRHVLVELPGPRRDRLAARLASPGPLPAPTFVAAVAELGPFRGVVLANELLDALPFRRLIRRDGAWREIAVTAEAGRLVPVEVDLVRALPPPALPEADEGTVLEVSEASEAWLREVADHLVDGRVLLLDYGREEPELVRAFRSGTLAVARRHRAAGDPLEAPGTADLSAFVNLTRIKAAAERAGLEVVADLPQAEALGRWGFERLRQAALAAAPEGEARVRVQLAAKNLLFGFEGFRVLELAPRRRPR